MSRQRRAVVATLVVALGLLLLGPATASSLPSAPAGLSLSEPDPPSTALGEAVPATPPPSDETSEPASGEPSEQPSEPAQEGTGAATGEATADPSGEPAGEAEPGGEEQGSGEEQGGGLLPALGGLPRLPTIQVSDCTNPPEVSGPATGPAGQIEAGPDQPRSGDPFAPDATVTAYEVYGWGGFAWVDYDLGCGPDAVRAPARSNLGNAARLLLLGLTVATAATVAVIRLAFDEETLGVLDPILQVGVDLLGANIWATLGWIALAVTGLLILASAREGLVARQARSAGAALSITVLVLLVVSYPLAGMGALDRSVLGAVSVVNTAAADVSGQPDGDVADAVAGNLHNGILYPTWLAGNVGRYDGETAERYGPLLFDASTLTRAEARVLEEDPVAGAAIVEQKQQQYEAVAAEIEEADPQAYAYLEGNNNEGRIAYALLGWLAWLSAALFVLASALILLYALIVARLLIVALPLIAVVAVLPGRRHHLTRPLMYVVGVLWSGVRFGVVGAIYMMVLSFLLGPGTGLPFVLLVLLLGVLTAAAVRVARPWSALRAIAGGWRLDRSALPTLPSSDRNVPPVHRRDDVFDGKRPEGAPTGEPAETEATRSLRERRDRARKVATAGLAAGSVGSALTGRPVTAGVLAGAAAVAAPSPRDRDGSGRVTSPPTPARVYRPQPTMPPDLVRGAPERVPVRAGGGGGGEPSRLYVPEPPARR